MNVKENVTPIRKKPTWKLKYTIERGEFKDDEHLTGNQGLTQDMVMTLLMDTDDGLGVRMSTQIYEDPDKPNPNRQFQALMSIATSMQRDNTVPKWQKLLADKVVLMLRDEGAKAVKAGGVRK